jgi:DNA-binding IscR family transcriptional regulator
VSHRGTKGGYSLSRPPGKITVAEIIRALEGPIAMTDCNENRCDLEKGCPTRPHWQVVNRTIVEALGQLTLEAMGRPVTKSGSRFGVALPAIAEKGDSPAARAAGSVESV